MNELWDERQAAKHIGCSVSLLRKFRLLGGGPAFCKIGRLVRYRQADLESFISANTVAKELPEETTHV